jgi:hypothetical protein
MELQHLMAYTEGKSVESKWSVSGPRLYYVFYLLQQRSLYSIRSIPLIESGYL